MKNVFDFRKALIDEYAKFSTSFAKPSAEDIAARLKEEYDSGRYWREPLIQINPNYEKDKTVDDLAAAGVMTAECAAIFQLFKQEVSLFFTKKGPQLDACPLADWNSLVHDWGARQKIGGLNLTYGYVKQIPTLAPSAHTEKDIAFIVPRVLELTYTSYSLKPWAEALGYNGEPFTFDEERRGVLKAELDVFFAKKYGLTEEEFRYILDPKDVKGESFPSESFRTLRDDELSRFGEYRTKRLALEAWERMNTL